MCVLFPGVRSSVCALSLFPSTVQNQNRLYPTANIEVLIDSKTGN